MTEFLNTDELAALLGVRPGTVRSAYCHRGNYLGLVPRKLPNRMLRWPREDAEALVEGGAKQQGRQP